MTKIIWDTDALSAFLWINKFKILIDKYAEYENIALEPVIEELKEVNHLYQRFLAYQQNFTITDLNVTNIEEIEYFSALTERMGVGEAACIAYSKFYNGEYIGSNNLSDIQEECEKEKITIKTTGTILCELVESADLSLTDAEEIWTKMKAKRRKLPECSFNDYYSMYQEEHQSV